jgi:competence protein ComEA
LAPNSLHPTKHLSTVALHGGKGVQKALVNPSFPQTIMTKAMLVHLSPKERFGYACIGGLLLFAFGYIGARHLRTPAPIVFSNAAQKISSPDSSASQGIVQGVKTPSAQDAVVVVHVAGAVSHPGVFRLAYGARVVDAVHAAGGPTHSADIDAINLAAKIVDGSQLRIPSKSETAPSRQRASVRVEPAADIDKQGGFTPVAIEPSYLAANATVVSTSSDSHPLPASGSRAKKEVSAVNVNTGRVEDLQSLPGVGPLTAQKIVDFRKQAGPFKSVDGLLDVPGIGPKKLEKMRPYVKL